jgi:hypothetical protein
MSWYLACYDACLIATRTARTAQRLIRMSGFTEEFFPLLNELFALSRGLAARGIQTQAWHPWIRTFRKGEAIVAELNQSGDLARVSLLSADEVAGLRNIAPDFHNSFPGLNLNCPVLIVPDCALWNQPEELWKAAVETTRESPLAYVPKDLRRLDRLLGDFPLKEIAPRLRGDAPKLRATVAILDRLGLKKPDAESFIHDLSLQIVAAAHDGLLSQATALAILYGKPNKKKLRLEEWKTTLIFDVSDIDRFPYRVADPAIAAEWSAILLASDSTSSAGAAPFVCSLSGLPGTLMDGKMPSPNLKILGPTVLMSMNADIPCQARYGQTSTAIFRVGKYTVQRMNDSLLFITEPSRREKTWAGMPNGSRDPGDLLIAYLEEEPDTDIPLAGFFADIDRTPGQELATYEARTAHIPDALRLREKPGKDSHIKVIALSKIDKGRAQVVFSARYTTAAIYAGRDRWLAGTRNVPNIAIPFLAKGKPVVWTSGYQPSPAEAMVSFKRQWLRAGHTYQNVPGVDLGSIYAILLELDAAAQASWLLDRYLGLTESLLIGFARSLSARSSLSELARKEALIAVGMYGILLLRQGRQKEIYMESRDYLVGQFLQFADLLHKLYCVRERKCSIPAQLIGNAAIPMALQSPRRAIQVLVNRMPVYLAWAERYQGEDAGLAKWTRNELGRLSAALKDENLDLRVSANGKAELLLGYLANATRHENQETF